MTAEKTGLIRSWIESANDSASPFPLNNLPCGVFSVSGSGRRCGVAIGDRILDVTGLEESGSLTFGGVFSSPSWNDFMALGPASWAEFRHKLQALLAEGSNDRPSLERHLVVRRAARLYLPFEVAEYTDFYSGRNHAFNVGSMFRGPENALPPNWLHIPIGYNGRASSVVVSGTEVRRPWGQIKGFKEALPRFAPSARFDFELEMGAIVGRPSDGPLTLDEAHDAIFGYVLLNDWSARDIQAWEYQPLGPFQAKATATTISPWVVMAAALEPFRVPTPTREVELMDYLKDTDPMLYDIELSVRLRPEHTAASEISRTNFREMYYSPAQQLAHHTLSGCPMRAGDLLGSGTISGSTKHGRGSLLELSWGGKEPLTLDCGATRSFLEDGDEVTFEGFASGDGYRIGFGGCSGKILPALDAPYDRS